MQEGDNEMRISEEDQKEIDFLKKNKKKNKGLVIKCAVVIAVIFIAIFAKLFIIGEPVYDDIIGCEVKVEGNKLTVRSMTIDSMSGISSVKFKEEDGIVVIEYRTVKASLFYSGDVENTYIANKAIKGVRNNARILWFEGETITPFTARVYNTRHDYIGTAYKNGQTAFALKMGRSIGDFTNELQTSNEPYGWNIIMEKEIDKSEEEIINKDMRSYAYILISTIGNLGEVTYKYKIDGKDSELTVTQDEATKYFGKDIKECGKKIHLLQELIEKTGIKQY